MIDWRIRTGLLVILMFGTAIAADLTLSESEKRLVEGLGITQQQVETLSTQDRVKLKQIIKDKPAAEVKSFIVTRSFMRIVKASGRTPPKLTSDEQATIKENFDIGYCKDFDEQLDALNALLFYGIEPARGVDAGKLK
jgi:hypothetical protein